MSADCRSATFRGATSDAFQGIQAGAYGVRLFVGEAPLPLAFSLSGAGAGSGGSGETDNASTSESALVTVVDAAVARFLDQSAVFSSSGLSVTVRVGLDSPIALPTALALRLSDATAAEVTPSVVTWRPGEVADKEITLRLLRAVAPGEAALWAEAMPVNNVAFGTDAPPRVAIVAPAPTFYVVANQAVYRKPVGGSSSTTVPAPELVPVAIRRTVPSPFPSTFMYNVTVLQTIGCVVQSCATAVSGSGVLSIAAAADVVNATVVVSWAALPAEAIVRVGLVLTPLDNADVVAVSANSTALYVFGTVYGTCPAGTSGPWQGSAAATAAPQDPVALMMYGQGSGSQPLVASQVKRCSDASLLTPLLSNSPSAAMLPVLTACNDGISTLVPNTTAGSRSTASPAPSPALSPGSSAPNPSSPAVPIELQVPFGQDSSAVFIPLRSVAETVVLINTTCTPVPNWQTVVLPGSATGAAGAAAAQPGAQPGAGSAWARWSLASAPQTCYALLGVFDTVQTKQRSGGGTSPSQSPPPSAKPAGPQPAGPTPTGAPPGMSPAASPGSGKSGDSAAGAGINPNLPIFSMALLRSFNVTLRPLSDPDIFSGKSLSLTLLHPPSGRYLPLCGLSQQLLYAAAVQQFGKAFDRSSAAQLAWAAATMTQAIRGNPDAMMTLRPAGATPSGQKSGGSSAGGRRLQRMGDSLRRWLAGRLPSGWRRAAREDGAGAAAAAAEAEAGGRAELGEYQGSGRELNRASTSRRNLQAASGPAPALVPARAPVTSSPPSPATPSPLEPPTASPRYNPSTPSVRPAMPGPSPPLDSGSGTTPRLQGNVATAATAPDGFYMPDGNGGTAHVLFNPQYVEWCNLSDAQMVDLALLDGPYDMALQASSGGAVLELAGGADVLVGPATRAALRKQREEAAAAAAVSGSAVAPPVASRGSGGSSTKITMDSRGQAAGTLSANSVNKVPLGASPTPSAGAPRPPPLLASGGPSPGPAAATPASSGASPSAGPYSSPAPSQGSSGGGVDCLAPPPLLTADQRLVVPLLAADRISTATVQLHLYVDFAAAAAAVVRVAAACQGSGQANNGSSAGVGGSAGGNGRLPPSPSTSRPLLSWPLPLSPLDACQPCGGGTYSSALNSSACQPCSPGSFTADTYSPNCTLCAAGSFTTQPGSTACRPCYAGSFTPRAGSTNCSVCADGTTTMADGASLCIAPPTPTQGDSSMIVSFQVLLNMSQKGDSAAQAASGIVASQGSIVKLLIAADTAEALRIAPTQVRVSLMEVSPSSFLVNVSATMPMGQTTGAGAGSGAADGSSGSPGTSPSKEVDADTLINRLVDNPDSFPRTRQATGGSLQVQYVQRQVVTLDQRSGGLNMNVVLWPTLAGTAILAVVVGFACSRYCRRRRGRQGVSLPPLTDALGRLCPWKVPTSPPVFVAFGQLTSLELQEVSSAASVPRHRARGSSKSSLPSLGVITGTDSHDVIARSGSVSEVDILTMMYTRDVLAAPRI